MQTASTTSTPAITRWAPGRPGERPIRLLCGLLFFIPVSEMAVGAGLGALWASSSRRVDIAFQDQVRDLVKPGTSALFLMLEKVIPDKAVEAMLEPPLAGGRDRCRGPGRLGRPAW
jgi:hypothetical protein